MQNHIDNLMLSIRAHTCLRRVGLTCIENIDRMSDAELLSIKNLGTKSLREIRQAIRDYKTEMHRLS